MQKFKIDIYNQEKPEIRLKYKTLDKIRTQQIINKIKCILSVNENVENTQSMISIAETKLQKKIELSSINETNIISDIFINKGKLSENSELFIFWDFDTLIDQFELKVLIDNWEYIWYDVSDEVILIYCNLNDFLVLISERGYVKTNNIL